MSEHLTECPMKTKDSICRCLPCICDALRTYEEAVLDAAVQRVKGYLQHDVADGWMPRRKAHGIIDAVKGDQR
jgi:hypothetical protein